jgi:hypothetical protein
MSWVNSRLYGLAAPVTAKNVNGAGLKRIFGRQKTRDEVMDIIEFDE